MSKKKLLILPIVAIMVAVMGVTVFAGSPSVFKITITDKDKHDVTDQFDADKAESSAIKPSNAKGLQDAIDKVNKKVNVSDLKFKVGYEIKAKSSVADKPYKVVFDNDYVPKDAIGVVIHKKGDSYQFKVLKSGEKYYIADVNDFSPFCLYYAKPASSAQTGDFAPAYIAMIAVALLASGTVFAVRAKKASK